MTREPGDRPDVIVMYRGGRLRADCFIFRTHNSSAIIKIKRAGVRITRGNKMKHLNPVLVTTMTMALSLSGFSVMAEEQQPIIVTATKTAQTADDTISPVIVISRENLETQTGAEIADILHHYAGIDIGRTGGPGQQTSIFIRGANSNHTLVMIDGVNINPDIGNAPLQNIRLDMIERIEIIKGPRSTLYGSQAIGGVINIITRQAKEGSHYEVHASGGSFATSEYGFSAHNKSGDSAAGITFNTSSSDGFPTLSTTTINRGYENMSVNLYGKRKLGNTHLEFTHNFSRGTTEYMAGFPAAPVDQDFENSLTALSINNNPSTNWASKVKLSFMKDLIEQNPSTSYVQTKRSVIDWQNDIQVNDSNLLTAGLSASHERAASGTSFDEKIDYYALFMQDNFQSGDHHIVAGIRANEYETFGSHATYNLEYAYAINKNLRLNAAANSGFRAPSSTDRFGFGGNPDLNPEESANTEIGMQYKVNKHQFSLNYFNNNIDNLIVYYDPTGTFIGNMENIGKATINGIEANYQYTDKNWAIGIDAINQDPRDKTNDSLLLRRTKEKYSLSLAHLGDNHRVQFNITHVGAREDFATSLDAYTLIGLSGQYKFTKNTSINGRIENLSDEEYEVAAGYLSPERSYYIGIKYNFD